MSDDWAKKYIEVHKQKQQEQHNRQVKASLAQAGARGVFQQIRDRIKQDLRTFHDAGVLQNLRLKEELTHETFGVVFTSSLASSYVTLEIALNITLIKYTYTPSQGNERFEQKEGTLRVCSTLEGDMAVYKNGDKFADVSDVSEFLLKPLLNYIDG